ncbi:MAG: response regulator transcription factor [Catenulispora sp.]
MSESHERTDCPICFAELDQVRSCKAAASLSRREREVFVLLASGPSNADLAARLHLTERTVKAHVSNILRKQGLSRLQACLFALAYQHARTCKTHS